MAIEWSENAEHEMRRMGQEVIDEIERREADKDVTIARLTHQIQLAQQFVGLWERGDLPAEYAIKQVKLDLERAFPNTSTVKHE